MTLREARIDFSYCIAQLVVWAHEQGIICCFDKDGMKHMANSNHYKGLAKDLIRYSETGEYLTHVDDYRALGEKWKTLHPLARWGGDFVGAWDSGHFSFEWAGVR